MSAEFGLLLAFVTGLTGISHCLGMCGGIASGFFFWHGRGRAWWPLALYHSGRILTYALLATLGAASGQVLTQVGLMGKAQGVLMMAAGAGVALIGLRRLWQGIADAPKAQPLIVRLQQAPPWQRPLPSALAGVLNGLVPCALVFSVAVPAVATGEPLQAALLMLTFGAGTLVINPLMSLVGAHAGERLRGMAARLAGLPILVFGLWTFHEGWTFFDIMRGLAN
ncbi:MAG: sulfite exporter TauE/SafE family protein [Gammaproteobacteria bacterium]|nr:sulfite exporter TauE/SafE family protein [Gammaproteobacteria bacterium]MBU1653745.1 sulfite exporter TauE/SafE family protein [Gammaproteobacteria bacterium]MBU1959622.1 sulfite exporter TauE/SafE family protein [Gammaproteobacteria bacterium]